MAKSTPPPFAVSEFKLPEGMRYCTIVQFTGGDRHIIGLNGDGIATVWDAETIKLVRSQKLRTEYGPPSAYITPDHKHIAPCFVTKPTILVETETLQSTPLLDYYPSKMAFSSNGKLTAVAIKEKLLLMTRDGNQEIATFSQSEFEHGLSILQFVGNTEELLIQIEEGIFSWIPGAKKLTQKFRFTGIACGMALSADGSTFVCRQMEKPRADYATLFKIRISDWKAQPLSLRLKRKDCHDRCCISPDGRFFATSTGGAILIWDLVEDKQWLKWQKPNYRSAMGMAFSSDGQRLVCTPDYQVHVLDFRTGAKSHLIEGPTLKSGEHHCVLWVGPDDQMDRVGGYDDALNLPVLCEKCRLRDVNFVANPYLLVRKIDAPVDMAPAVAGNMLVHETARRVLEAVAPGECKFYPTINKKTMEATPWSLAVPQYSQSADTPSAHRCPACQKPECWERNDEDYSPVSKHEIFRSEGWMGMRSDDRHLFISIRLEMLLKKLGLRGMLRYANCKQVPTNEDLAWVDEKAKALSKASGTPTVSKADIERWFSDYLKKSAKKKSVVYDFAAVEKKQQVKLPQSYRDFLSTVGTKTFKDVNQEEGFAVHILPPQKLDFKGYRMPADPSDDEKEHKINGVMFATTDHGDVFCFDIDAKGPDYSVYHYQHETDEFEPFAENFAAAIKRFVGKD